MFGKLKEKFGFGGGSSLVILAPVEGEAVPISEVSDPTFGEEILGKGVAIKPSKGRVVSPVDGTVSMMFETGHAVSIMSDGGTEVLVHVGLDTINLKGKYYKAHVKNDDKIKAGDLLIEFDIAGIKSEGYDVITPVVICNSSDYSKFEPHTGPVKEQDELIQLGK